MFMRKTNIEFIAWEISEFPVKKSDQAMILYIHMFKML